MASNRGFDSLDSKSRLRLIEAASDLLGEEGYQSISARRIAERAGLKPQLVHYYFRSMEELVVAVFRRSSAAYCSLHDEALSQRHPLRALWELNCELPEAHRMTEYVALRKRFPALREEMRKTGENFRQLQIEAVERLFERRSIDPPPITPAALVMLMSAIARNFVIERETGVSLAHRELRELVDKWLNILEPIEASVQHAGASERHG